MVSDSNFGPEVDLKQQSANNYDYDRNGNLMSDVKSGLTNVSRNLYGKIRLIAKAGTQIGYRYNASGSRVEKLVTTGTGSIRTVYIRDAQLLVLIGTIILSVF